MSVAATTAVFFSSLPGPQKLVALALADHADPVGEHIRPSVKRLAVMVTMSERSVQRALKVLIAAGAIEVTEPAGRYTPIEYRLTKQVMGDNLTPMTTPWVTKEGGHGCQITPTMGDIAVSPELKKETTTELKTTPLNPPKGFDDFWKAYPRHTAKDSAIKAWNRLKPSEQLCRTFLEALKRQNLGQREPQYIPHPATWLNGRRWEDEVNQNGHRRAEELWQGIDVRDAPPDMPRYPRGKEPSHA